MGYRYCKVLLMLDIFDDEKEIFEIYFFNFSEEIKSKWWRKKKMKNWEEKYKCIRFQFNKQQYIF